MKVTELTGAELDYWVAKAEGENAYVRHERITLHNADGSLDRILVDEDQCFRKRWNEEDKPETECKGTFCLCYSTDWKLGGPILDDNAIGFHPISDAEMVSRGAHHVLHRARPDAADRCHARLRRQQVRRGSAGHASSLIEHRTSRLQAAFL